VCFVTLFMERKLLQFRVFFKLGDCLFFLEVRKFLIPCDLPSTCKLSYRMYSSALCVWYSIGFSTIVFNMSMLLFV
jgi:hypothetical protein